MIRTADCLSRYLGRRHYLQAALLLLLNAVGCDRQPTAENNSAPPWQAQIASLNRGDSFRLHIQHTPVEDHDLAQLSAGAPLRELLIEDSRLTLRGIRFIAQFQQLEVLKLRGQPVNDDELRQLCQLPKLRVLNIPHSAVTDDGLALLTTLKELELLRIGSSSISDKGISHIAVIPQLRFLHLIEVPLTDAGLLPLGDMPQLESFYLDGSVVTDAGLAELIEARPDLHFHRDQQHVDWDPRRHDHAHD